MKPLIHVAFIFTILVSVFSSQALAQDRPDWQGAVSFPDGTVIRNGVGVVPAGSIDVGLIRTGVLVGYTSADDIAALPFIRTLRLADGRVVCYEVRVKPLGDDRFEVKLFPGSPNAEQAKNLNIDLSRVEATFLGNYPNPLTINKGDILAIEVLKNPRTGVKLVDYFLVSDRSASPQESSEANAAQPRPLTISDIELHVFDFEIRRNAQTIYKSKGGMGGRFIWLDVPDIGRFLFTFEPTAGANGFESVAYVSGQHIVFTHAGNRYEITAKEPVIPASGTFSLWLRCDPTFSVPLANPFNKSHDQFSMGAADDLGFKKEH